MTFNEARERSLMVDIVSGRLFDECGNEYRNEAGNVELFGRGNITKAIKYGMACDEDGIKV